MKLHRIIAAALAVLLLAAGCSPDNEPIPSPLPDKPFEGRTYSVLGNSISTFEGYIPSGFANWYKTSQMSVNSTWWMRFGALSGATFEKNASWSGSTVCTSDPSKDNSFFGSDLRTGALGKPDFILIAGGTNDWGCGFYPLGEYRSSPPFSLDTFRGAYSYLLDKLRTSCPDAKIVCMSILPRSNGLAAKNSQGWSINDANASIKKIAGDFGAAYVNFDNCGMESDIWKYTIDGLHPNMEGMRLIAKHLLAEMVKLFPDGGQK